MKRRSRCALRSTINFLSVPLIKSNDIHSSDVVDAGIPAQVPTLNPDTEYSALVVRDEQEPPNENGGMKTDTLEEEAQAPSGKCVVTVLPCSIFRIVS